MVPNIKPRAKINHQNLMSNMVIISISTPGILDPCSQRNLTKQIPQYLLNQI